MIVETDIRGLEKLVSENEIVLADFYAEWCGSCRTMERVLEEFGKEHGEVVIARIDTEAAKSEAEELGITTLPTLILYKAGKEYIRVRGGRTRAELERLLTL